MIGIMPIVVQFASPTCGTAVRYQVLAGVMKLPDFAYCNNSLHEKDWCYRKRGTQAT